MIKNAQKGILSEIEFSIPVILESHYGILLNTENGDIDISATPIIVESIPKQEYKNNEEDTKLKLYSLRQSEYSKK